MANFIVYDTETGRILRTGSCPESMIGIQAVKDGTAAMMGSVDPAACYVDVNTNKIVTKPEAEQLAYKYQTIKHEKPNLSDINDIDDATLNDRIESFYYGQVSASDWRSENYAVLRRAAYSKLSERADAAVKIASGDEDLIAEGQSQLDALNAHDLEVKLRFTKE